MNVPSKIIERRAELERIIEAHQSAIRLHESELRAEREELFASMARLGDIDLCIAAIEDAAETLNAEAVGAEDESAATSGTPEAEIAPAGIVEDIRAETGLPGSPSAKKPRAPKRDIRGMVLEYVEHYSGGNLDQDQIWRLLGVTPRAVALAVAYWQAKGRLTLDGGVVRLRTEAAADAPSDEITQEQISALNRIVPDDEFADYKPVEITGQGDVEVQDMGFLHPEMARQALVGFLERNPDSTMAEISEAGIPAAEVYRAEREGVVLAKAHGLYALVEPQQSEPAE